MFWKAIKALFGWGSVERENDRIRMNQQLETFVRSRKDSAHDSEQDADGGEGERGRVIHLAGRRRMRR